MTPQERYRKSKKGKETRKRYRESSHGRKKSAQRRKTREYKAYMKKYMQEYQKNPKNKLKKRKYRFTWRGKAADLLRGMKQSAKRKNLGKVHWTLEEIETLITKGFCCKTGISFQLNNEFTEVNKRNPFAPSPDRIDNTKGYTKENTQWVCWMYNQLKGQATEKEVDYFLTTLTNFRKQNAD